MSRHAGARTSPVELVLRVLVVATLTVDAVVHLRLAGMYQAAASGGVGEGTLFRVEAVLAILSALFVAARGSKAAYAAAFVVTLGGLVVVLLYRYVNVPAFGPIPAMYEPVWFFQKSLSAVAQGVGAVAAAAGFVHTRRR
ncbi:hypothetical protein CLV47_101205 [Antricoccus suffuscus]|uniref:Integral membrane protein n=1 Tax=Antricoccus suffuscus TaxID=1629062 RepID=A0A2T1A658_9ACTN|nr:hypothetical protein [Antricoccus suffuscus]PRZ44081.1 hypothetical protein CLV47_101205 [Antricoccus suffuscus]